MVHYKETKDQYSCKHRHKNPQKHHMRIRQDIKRMIHHNQVEFNSWHAGWFNIQKSLNIIHHIKRLKKKTHMNISIAGEKAFDKIKHPFLIKPLSKLEMKGISSN